MPEHAVSFDIVPALALFFIFVIVLLQFLQSKNEKKQDKDVKFLGDND